MVRSNGNRYRQTAIHIGARRLGAVWPLSSRAQQPALPVVGFINGSSADASADRVRAFRKGLSEAGYVEGQNVTVDYHWLEGQFDRPSFDHLVGACQQRLRYCKAELFGGLEIDN
jgi:hypothetical protein